MEKFLTGIKAISFVLLFLFGNHWEGVDPSVTWLIEMKVTEYQKQMAQESCSRIFKGVFSLMDIHCHLSA